MTIELSASQNETGKKMIESINNSLKSFDREDLFFTSLKKPSEKFEISIEEIGDLKYPLSGKIIQSIIKKSRLAPFGWRDQTVVDTKVRNVWEISSEQIKISEKSFQEIIEPSLEKIRTDLGLADEGKLIAKLHNLLIYEKGQFFSSHQDTEKTDDMVGTMIILLPSLFKGGTLVVDHQGNRKSFHPPQKKEDKLNIVAFYADCFHKIKKVTSGYRVALTYNLLFRPDSLPTLKVKNNPEVNNPKLMTVVKKYFSKPDPQPALQADTGVDDARHPSWLVVLLNHQYSQKNLNWLHLKGTDRMKVRQLLTVADKLELDAYLALADIHESWSTDTDDSFDNYKEHFYSDEEEEFEENEFEENEAPEVLELGELFDENYSLNHWIDRDGKKLNLREHIVPKEMFCWTKAHDYLKPFRSDYEGYMGNYGNTMDYWYHRAALVLWPKKIREKSLFVIDPSFFFEKVKKVLLKDLNTGLPLVKNVLNQKSLLRSIGTDRSTSVLEVAVLVQDKKIAGQLLSEFDLRMVLEANFRSLSYLIDTYGEDWSIELLKTWSKAEYFYSKKEILGINKLCECLKTRDRVIHWILNHQLSLFFKNNKEHEKKASQVEIKNQKISFTKRIHEFLRAFSIVKKEDFLNLLLKHLLGLKKIYSAMDKAKLVLGIPKKRFFEKFKKALSDSIVSKLEDFVSKERLPGDLSIPDEVPCSCSDCGILKKFLKSHNDEYIWPLAKQRRRHIHEIIDGMDVEVTHVTKKQGSPYKLILSKNQNYFTRETKRKKEAGNYLTRISQEIF